MPKMGYESAHPVLSSRRLICHCDQKSKLIASRIMESTVTSLIKAYYYSVLFLYCLVPLLCPAMQDCMTCFLLCGSELIVASALSIQTT